MTLHRRRMGLAHGEKGSLELQKISQRSAEYHGVNLRVANKRKTNQYYWTKNMHMLIFDGGAECFVSLQCNRS